jgi:cytochrome P450
MHGFEWSNIRGEEGTGFVRALRHILVSKLPEIYPTLRSYISHELRAELRKKQTSPESYRISVYDTAKRLVAKTNCLVFFGPGLASDEAFLSAAAGFPYESALAAEIIRFVPSTFSRWLARKATRNYSAATTFRARLHEEVAERMDRFRNGPSKSDGTAWDDGLQWLIETSLFKQEWDVDRMVGEVMGIWYGSVHTLSIAVTYALLDLYERPEYIDDLRHELACTPLETLRGMPEDLPVLDAFLKESARLSAFESTAVRRQALKPYTFQSGLRVKTGDWVCVPTRSVMRDPERFPEPMKFDPYRHRSTAGSGATTRQRYLVDSNKEGDGTLIWGLSRISCPGRFYAALVMKLVVATFVEDYECELPRPCEKRSFQWRSSIIPRRSVQLDVRDRRCSDSS